MKRKCYSLEVSRLSKAGDREAALTTLQEGLNLYGNRLLAVFNNAPELDYPLLFVVMDKIRQGLAQNSPPSLRALADSLDHIFSTTVVSIKGQEAEHGE